MSNYKKTTVYFIGIVILLVAMYFVFPEFGQKFTFFVKSAQDLSQHKNLAEEIREELFAPPLQALDDAEHAQLTIQGVITLTNAERQKENIAALSENAFLDKAAQQKLNDMFAHQYFEHISPEGNGPGYLAQQVNYNYIVIGENLALGNFKDDAALVAAWMASPGHRANIMHTRFKEIGVAVGEGMFNGKKTWLAVQEFGAPASLCPTLDTKLKNSIEDDKNSTTQTSKTIENLHTEISAMSRDTQEEQQAYNKKVDEYNNLVVRYEADLAHLRSEIDQYNVEVRAYNACIKE